MAERSGLARLVAGSAVVLTARRAATMMIFAVSTAFIARYLGPGEFGGLAAALAAYQLALATSDVGFSLVLGRDMAVDESSRGRMLRAGVQTQAAWSAVLALVLAGLGLASGLDTSQGQALVLLAPGVAISGLAGARQAFLVLYETRRLAMIDVPVNLVQAGAMIVVAAAGGGPAGVAIVMSVGTAVNALLISRLAFRLVDDGRPDAADRRRFIRRALPVGIASVVTSFYFSVDMVLLAWLVSGSELGQYAVAVKVLSLLVAVPGLVMQAALPGLSTSSRDPAELSALTGRVWHWLAALGLPLCVGCAVFADPLVSVVFGADYADAVPLVRVLSIAGALAVFGNILGTLMVARNMGRKLLVQSLAALAVNVTLNLLLVPAHGVMAAAWITVGTELVVIAAPVWWLRGALNLGSALTSALRPTLAVAAGAAVGIALTAWPALAVPAAAATFVAAVVLLDAWPEELGRVRSRPTPT